MAPPVPRIHFHVGDLPEGIDLGSEIAVDIETNGIKPTFNRVCLIQLRGRNTDIHLIQIKYGQTKAPNLRKLLESKKSVKIMQYARTDIAFMKNQLNISCMPIFCTKIASKLVRTYTERHGLKELMREFFNIDISKQQQQSDWGVDKLSEEQKEYAASDVLYLHDLKDKMVELLEREKRMHIAQKCFEFLPTRAELDCQGWDDMDIFAHNKGIYARD
ncbi:MAG TPA: ribonuclease D [Alphaproteobacteria bacterium]